MNLFLILLFSISLISCSSSNEQTTKPNASLTNTRWFLRVMNDKKIFTPESGKEIYITFTSDGNKASGSGGCNNFFSTYKVAGKKINFSNVGGTEMYCDNRMETESEFYRILERAKTYKIRKNILSLFDSNKVIAKFEAIYLN
ncbi:MAG: META domain-containing protein [Bacteroidota bacterium]|nr:META domain-containing protein [Bacteroidota bacterium]